MSNTTTGGPAFPAHHFDLADNEHGMTLRDYFAAACFDKIGLFPQILNVDLGGNLTKNQQDEFDRYIQGASTLAYRLADAMLKAREQ